MTSVSTWTPGDNHLSLPLERHQRASTQTATARLIVGCSLRTAAAGLASQYKDMTDTTFGRCLANAVRFEITVHVIRIYQRTLPTTMRHTISLAVPLGYNVLQRQQTLSYMIVLMEVKAG